MIAASGRERDSHLVEPLAAVFRFTPPDWEWITTVALATVVLVLVSARSV